MPDVGVRLVGPVALTTSPVTLYTVPAATTTTVRSIHIANEAAAAVTVTLSIGTDGAGKRFLGPGLLIPAASSYDWSGFLILAATEVIQSSASAATSLTATISGIQTT